MYSISKLHMLCVILLHSYHVLSVVQNHLQELEKIEYIYMYIYVIAKLNYEYTFRNVFVISGDNCTSS